MATKLQSAGAAAHATRGTSLSGATASVVVRVRHDGYLSVLARVRVCTSMSADAGQHWQPECRGSAAALLQQCCPSAAMWPGWRVWALGPGRLGGKKNQNY